MNNLNQLEHGGQLLTVAQKYQIPIEHWLDLSTGINPHSWLTPEVLANMPIKCWQQFPQENDNLIQSASGYYNVDKKFLLAVAGSQMAIQAMPRISKFSQKSRVGIYSPSYNEHHQSWQKAGHRVFAWQKDSPINDVDILVIVNPNNPDGKLYSINQLRRWQKQLAERGGTLIVDEAFIDVTPHLSIAKNNDFNGLIVLRSLGKFFGLAGSRLGFVLAQADILCELQNSLGIWSISHPTRFIACKVLADFNWHKNMRIYLQLQSQRLADLLIKTGFNYVGGCGLFQTVSTKNPRAIQDKLARKAIWVRAFDINKTEGLLRFGLPANEDEWCRLRQSLSNLY